MQINEIDETIGNLGSTHEKHLSKTQFSFSLKWDINRKNVLQNELLCDISGKNGFHLNSSIDGLRRQTDVSLTKYLILCKSDT